MIDLSFPIRPHFRWKVAREVRASHAKGDNFESSIMTLGCHAYTHVDAPRHFLAGDRHIAEMPVDQWVGEAAVVDLSHLGTTMPSPPPISSAARPTCARGTSCCSAPIGPGA